MAHSDPVVFAAGERAWLAGLGSLRDVVRQTLVTRQLLAHLPDHVLEVLDVGCGQGTQAIGLARLGHPVTGLDASEVLLTEAEHRRGDEPLAVQDRLRFVRGDLFALDPEHKRRYDLVCCHGVAMYLPSLAQLVNVLVSTAAPGGFISLLTRNRAGIAMRAGMTEQWAAALDGFDATHYTNRLGIERARADTPAEAQASFREAGCETIAWYGVRLFTDHWGNTESPPDLDAIIAVEEQAGQRDPYRAVAALTHTIARLR